MAGQWLSALPQPSLSPPSTSPQPALPSECPMWQGDSRTVTLQFRANFEEYRGTKRDNFPCCTIGSGGFGSDGPLGVSACVVCIWVESGVVFAVYLLSTCVRAFRGNARRNVETCCAHVCTCRRQCACATVVSDELVVPQHGTGCT